MGKSACTLIKLSSLSSQYTSRFINHVLYPFIHLAIPRTRHRSVMVSLESPWLLALVSKLRGAGGGWRVTTRRAALFMTIDNCNDNQTYMHAPTPFKFSMSSRDGGFGSSYY